MAHYWTEISIRDRHSELALYSLVFEWSRIQMNGNELIAGILKQEGVELMTCYPNNPLIETAAEQQIRPVAFRHERGAIMAADKIVAMGLAIF